MEIWKNIIAPLIVAGIVGIFAFGIGRITAPETASVRASLEWIDVKNPIVGRLDSKAQLDFDKGIQSAMGVSGASSLLGKFAYNSEIRIAKLRLENNGNLRTKEIEVTTERTSALFPSISDETNVNAGSSLTLKPINPGSASTVYIVSPTWSVYSADPVRALHDGRKVEIVTTSTDSRDTLFAIRDYQIPLIILTIYMIAASFFFTCIVIVNIIAHYNVQFRASMLDKNSVQKTLDTIEYIKAHNPEKMPTPTSISAQEPV